MVLVDSSAWIAYLDPRTSKVDSLVDSLIRPNNQVVITGIIFQEVLQGIRKERSLHLTASLLGKLPFLIPHSHTHLNAAELFQKLAHKGKIPSTIDVLIASLAIQNRVSLLTLDRDFHIIAEHSSLKLFSII